MGRTRIRAYDALTFLLACSVVAVFVRSILPAPGTVQFDRPVLGSLLWPGAFQVSTNAPAMRVDFVAQARRYLASVASDEFRVATPESNEPVTIALAGAAPGRTASLSNPLAALMNIFAGRSGAHPAITIRRYESARFHEVYPGIDASYRVSDGGLELDFEIAPGGDPGAIRLQPGNGTRFEREGASEDVVFRRGEARYRLRRPVAFQDIDGARTTVPVRLVTDHEGLRFEVGAYDHSRPLTIDPLVATYSTFVGSSGDDIVNGLAADRNGNLYLTGTTGFSNIYPNASTFPTTSGSYVPPNPRSAGDPCAFSCGYILKLNANMQVIYGAMIFGLEPQAIAVDATGDVYATGHTLDSSDFPATPGVFANDPAGQVFALKLAPDGGSLIYAALFPGDIGRAIAVDSAGDAYVAGEAGIPNLPTTPGSVKPVYQATGDQINVDAFLLKINPSGSALVFGTYLGGTAKDTAYGLTLDAAGNALVVGQSFSSDFVGLPATNAGLDDAFLVQVAADGSAITNGRYFGGSGADYAAAISSDGLGGYYICGATESTDFPVTANVIQQRLVGTRNGWLARIDSGFNVQFSTYFGGSFIDGLLAVTSDPDGNAYLVGPTFSADMLTTTDAMQSVSTVISATLLASAGSAYYPQSHDAAREAFFAVMPPDGQQLTYATYLGGYYTAPRDYPPLGYGSSVARSPSGAVYVAGNADTASFPNISGGLRDPLAGQDDGFLTRFQSQSLYIDSAALLPDAAIDASYNVQLHASGGTAPYRWELVGFKLPTGLRFSSSGSITGSATNPQQENYGYQFTAKVTDGAGRTAYKSLFINVHWPGNAVCTTGACSLSVVLGQSFIIPPPIPARGIAPFSEFLSGELPPGSTVNSTTGEIVGSPNLAGQFRFTLTVEDALGTRTPLAWTVTVTDPNAPPPTPPPPPPSSGGGGGGGGLTPIDLALMLLLAVIASSRSRRAAGGRRPSLPRRQG